MSKNYYDILGVDKNATEDEIKFAYRKLASKYHPDVSHDEYANQKMAEINEAYSVLKDPIKRANYDQYGSNQDIRYNYNPNPNSYDYSSGFVFSKSIFHLIGFIIRLLLISFGLRIIFQLLIMIFYGFN